MNRYRKIERKTDRDIPDNYSPVTKLPAATDPTLCKGDVN